MNAEAWARTPTDASARDVREAIVERCRRGETAAWREVYRESGPYLKRMLRRLGAEERDLEDHVQDVFAIACRRIDGFDERSTLRTWLTGIALRVASQARRRQRVRRLASALLARGPGPAGPRTPEQDAGSAEARRLLHDLLARVGDRKREVFVLYEIEGLPGDEIAALLGCPVNTVWSRLRHARAEVRRMAERRLRATRRKTA